METATAPKLWSWLRLVGIRTQTLNLFIIRVGTPTVSKQMMLYFDNNVNSSTCTSSYNYCGSTRQPCCARSRPCKQNVRITLTDTVSWPHSNSDSGLHFAIHRSTTPGPSEWCSWGASTGGYVAPPSVTAPKQSSMQAVVTRTAAFSGHTHQ